MSKWLLLSIIMVVAAATLATARADQLSDLQDQIELAETKKKLAEGLQTLADLKKKLADTEVAISNARLDAAQKELAAAQERLKQPVQLMRMVSGTMTVIRNQTLTCDAMPFLRFQCNGETKCEFPVDANICGTPGGANDPMELSVSYSCGGQTIQQTFGSNRKGYLTCK